MVSSTSPLCGRKATQVYLTSNTALPVPSRMRPLPTSVECITHRMNPNLPLQVPSTCTGHVM